MNSIVSAERELGYVAAQWQDTDTHTTDRTRKYALRAAAAAVAAPGLTPRTRMAAMQFRVGELTADEFIRIVLEHVYAE
jgi:hypothetical protein